MSARMTRGPRPADRDATRRTRRLLAGIAWNDADMRAARVVRRRGRRAAGSSVDEDGNGNQLAWWGAPGTDAAADRLAPRLGARRRRVRRAARRRQRRSRRSTLLRPRASRRRGPSWSATSPTRRAPASASPAPGRSCSPGRSTPTGRWASKDADGITMAEALTARGRDPRARRPRPDALDAIGTFVELHVEQGRSLIAPRRRRSAWPRAIWPHGRWRLDFCGEANHAGATLMADRRDPMHRVRRDGRSPRGGCATEAGARATFGRLEVEPGGTNAIPSRVTRLARRPRRRRGGASSGWSTSSSPRAQRPRTPTARRSR